MRLDIPPAITRACQQLQAAGHQAVVVGGAVRNLLIQQKNPEAPGPKDYDVASSAPPGAVLALFGADRTLPTGIEHGTVTVLLRGQTPDRFEVTTFRADGEYSDGRRPDSVSYTTDLRRDLERRDFTVNAIAYDPVSGELHDPMGGLRDLEARVLRAVGNPEERFGEDALRMLRAARFAAQLGFHVDNDTMHGMKPCLSLLRRVSRERVRDELLKLLASPTPSRGLSVLFLCPDGSTSGSLCEEMLLGPQLFDALRRFRVYTQWAQGVNEVSPEARLAAFFWPLRDLPRDELAAMLESLKLPTKTLVPTFSALRAPIPSGDSFDFQKFCWDDYAVRKWMSQNTPEVVDLALELHATYSPPTSFTGLALDELRKAVVENREQQVPLRISDLAVGGRELMGLGLRPGRAIGAILESLLEEVLRDPSANAADKLLALAAEKMGNQ